jgi:serine/threonine protein kinase
MRESKYLNLTVSQVGESLRVSTRKAVKKYVPLKKLGSGSFGKVILVEERFSRVQYALKIIEKNTVFEDEMIE